MAFQEGTPEVCTMVAGADLSNSYFKVVEMNSNGAAVLAAANQGYGVLINKPKINEAASVTKYGRTKGIAGSAVAINDKLRVSSGGWLIPVNSGAAHPATFMFVGRAITAAASGSIFTVDFHPQLLVNVLSGAAIA